MGNFLRKIVESGLPPRVDRNLKEELSIYRSEKINLLLSFELVDKVYGFVESKFR